MMVMHVRTLNANVKDVNSLVEINVTLTLHFVNYGALPVMIVNTMNAPTVVFVKCPHLQAVKGHVT